MIVVPCFVRFLYLLRVIIFVPSHRTDANKVAGLVKGNGIVGGLKHQEIVPTGTSRMCVWSGGVMGRVNGKMVSKARA